MRQTLLTLGVLILAVAFGYVRFFDPWSFYARTTPQGSHASARMADMAVLVGVARQMSHIR